MCFIHATPATVYRVRDCHPVPPLAIMIDSQLQLLHLILLAAILSINRLCIVLDTRTFISSFQMADTWCACVQQIGKPLALISLKDIWFKVVKILYSLYHLINNNKLSYTTAFAKGDLDACSKGGKVVHKAHCINDFLLAGNIHTYCTPTTWSIVR